MARPARQGRRADGRQRHPREAARVLRRALPVRRGRRPARVEAGRRHRRRVQEGEGPGTPFPIIQTLFHSSHVTSARADLGARPPLFQNRADGPRARVRAARGGRERRARRGVRLRGVARRVHGEQGARARRALPARRGRVLRRGEAQHGVERRADPVLDVRRARRARLERGDARALQPALLRADARHARQRVRTRPLLSLSRSLAVVRTLIALVSAVPALDGSPSSSGSSGRCSSSQERSCTRSAPALASPHRTPLDLCLSLVPRAGPPPSRDPPPRALLGADTGAGPCGADRARRGRRRGRRRRRHPRARASLSLWSFYGRRVRK